MPFEFKPRTGETVLLDYEGRTVEAFVILASPNGKSLMLSFEAILGGHVGMMPVTVDDNNDYESLITGVPVTIRRMQ